MAASAGVRRALNALLVRELALAAQVLGRVRLDEVGALERVLEVGAEVRFS